MASFLPSLVLSIFCLIGVLGDDFSRCPSSVIRNQYLRTFRERCYEFAIFRVTYWEPAQLECAQKGGRLVTVNDMTTQQFLMQSLASLKFQGKKIWIGLNDRSSENHYVWLSGDVTHFTYWAPHEPSFLHGVEDCVVMEGAEGFHWEDHTCNTWPQHYSYICEYDMNPLQSGTMTVTATQPQGSITTGQPLAHVTFTTTSNALSRCPASVPHNQYLRTFGERCYEFAIDHEVYWAAAQQECTHHGGHLVTVNDMATQQFLMQSLASFNFKKHGIWIGLSDQNNENHFTWVSGEVTHFTYWAPGEPSFLHGVEDCVLMKSTKSYHWEDHACHVWPQHYTYICEYDMTPLPTTTMSTTVTQPQVTTEKPLSTITSGQPVTYVSKVTHPTVTVSTGQQFSTSPAVTSVSQGMTPSPITTVTTPVTQPQGPFTTGQTITKVLQVTSTTPLPTTTMTATITQLKVTTSTEQLSTVTTTPPSSTLTVTMAQLTLTTSTGQPLFTLTEKTELQTSAMTGTVTQPKTNTSPDQSLTTLTSITPSPTTLPTTMTQPTPPSSTGQPLT